MIFSHFLLRIKKRLPLQIMAKLRKYTFNSKTLSYEVQKRSRKSRVLRSLGVFVGGAISIVTILAYTAIAGAVGAGGLGDLAIRYGYQRRVPSMMWVTVVFLIVLVQVIQYVFSRVSTRIDKRLK